MWREFKAFLVKQNMLALALAFVVGAATNDVVKAIVDGFIMPIVGVATPAGEWRDWAVPIGSATTAADGTVTQNALQIGLFLSTLINFLIVAFVAWQITKWIIKPAPADEKPATRACPYCRVEVDAAATRCAHCTSEIAPATAA
ncbi:MAG TPA: MscL family protein [Gemmatimonadales bacterium]